MFDCIDPFCIQTIFANDIARIVPLTANLLCFEYYQLQLADDGTWQRVIVARVARPADTVLLTKERMTALTVHAVEPRIVMPRLKAVAHH